MTFLGGASLQRTSEPAGDFNRSRKDLPNRDFDFASSLRRSASRPPVCFDRDFQASRRVLRPQPRLIVQGRSLLPETSHSIAPNFSGSPLFDLELQKLGVSQFFLTLKTLLMKLRMNVV